MTQKRSFKGLFLLETCQEDLFMKPNGLLQIPFERFAHETLRVTVNRPVAYASPLQTKKGFGGTGATLFSPRCREPGP